MKLRRRSFARSLAEPCQDAAAVEGAAVVEVGQLR